MAGMRLKAAGSHAGFSLLNQDLRYLRALILQAVYL